MDTKKKALEKRLLELKGDLVDLQQEFRSIRKKAKQTVLDMMSSRDKKKIDDIRSGLGLK
jgi:predicted  nucleic acid-binding Zn-ribbon protein